MYGDKDLMLLGGKDPTKFARRCSRILFTHEERLNTYLADDGSYIFEFFHKITFTKYFNSFYYLDATPKNSDRDPITPSTEPRIKLLISAIQE